MQSQQYLHNPTYISSQPVQMFQDISQVAVPLIYYINNLPYICYPNQSDILYPMYNMCPVYLPYAPINSEQGSRGVGDLVTNIGDIVQEITDSKINSLENYVQKMEQDAINNITSEVKKNCFSLCYM